jgi:hypothetical protein
LWPFCTISACFVPAVTTIGSRWMARTRLGGSTRSIRYLQSAPIWFERPLQAVAGSRRICGRKETGNCFGNLVGRLKGRKVPHPIDGLELSARDQRQQRGAQGGSFLHLVRRSDDYTYRPTGTLMDAVWWEISSAIPCEIQAIFAASAPPSESSVTCRRWANVSGRWLMTLRASPMPSGVV